VATVSKVSIPQARRQFLDAPSPSLPELTGRWSGDFVGSSAVRAMTRWWLDRTALRAWRGKEFVGDRAYNLVSHGGLVQRSLEMRVSVDTSMTDGQPCVVLTYADHAPRPFRWMRDELRWLTPGSELLGLSMIMGAGRRLPPGLFLLKRHAHS
jgi:hypothetical protein